MKQRILPDYARKFVRKICQMLDGKILGTEYILTIPYSTMKFEKKKMVVTVKISMGDTLNQKVER